MTAMPTSSAWPLSDATRCWRVQAGTIDVFAARDDPDQVARPRRFLFALERDGMAFGAAPAGGHHLVAVPGADAVLIERALTDVDRVSGGVAGPNHSAEIWVERLSQAVAGAGDHSASLALDPGVPLPDALRRAHDQFFEALGRIERQRGEARRHRVAARSRFVRQQHEQRLETLAEQIGGRGASEAVVEEWPLLAAVRAVGAAQGISIVPAPASEIAEATPDAAFEAICRSSRIRARRVLLRDDWWRRDGGPLLAYTLDERPVALLPVASRRYELFDPSRPGRRTRIDDRTAATLAPSAFMLYRGLNDVVAGPLDLLRIGLRGRGRDVAMILLAGTAATLLGMVVPPAMALLVNHAVPDADRQLLLQIGLVLTAAAFGRAVFELTQGVALMRLETAAAMTAQAAVWDRVLKLPLSVLRRFTKGDLQLRTDAISQIRQQASAGALRTLFASFVAGLNLILMIVYSPRLAILAVMIAGVVIAITTAAGIATLKRIRPLQVIESQLFALTVQLVSAASKLRVSGAEERAFTVWGRLYAERLRLRGQAQIIEDRVDLFGQTLPIVASALLFWFAVPEAAGGSEARNVLSAGTFLAFYAAFGAFISGASTFSTTVIDVLEIVNLWERAKPLLDAPTEDALRKTHPGRLTGALLVDHVTFRYRPDGPLVLDDVTIRAEKGGFVALVGPSGSGKSTILRLLLGFELPEDGTVYYDGQDLAGLDTQALRRQLGVVLQSGRLLSSSIFENIAAGAVITMQQAWDAAGAAGLADDLANMPMGIHTLVTEGGTNLSGGQRQRLLIARALVLKPKIMFFDEATSALDNGTQAIVSASLAALGVTRVVIAHRLSTVRHADRIYVIEAGRVVQEGNFDALAAQEGLFKRLMARQLV